MRFRTRPLPIVYDEPLSIEEESAYHFTIDSFQENHAYSFLRDTTDYPTKPQVVALQLSRTPSLASISSKGSISRRNSGRTRKYTHSDRSERSVPSLVRSLTTRASSLEPNTPILSPIKRNEPASFTTKSSSQHAESQLVEQNDRQQAPQLIKSPAETMNMSIALAAFQIKDLQVKLVPTPAKPMKVTKNVYKTRSMALEKDGQEHLNVGRFSMIGNNGTGSQQQDTTLEAENEKRLSRAMARNCTLFDSKSAHVSLSPEDSISTRIAKREAGIEIVAPDVFDFELPGFDPRRNRVCV